MDISTKLNDLNLNVDNSIVIGSGILNALNIRNSNDIDVIVPNDTYSELARMGRFAKAESYGKEILTDELFEIGTSWGVLGQDQGFNDLVQNSQIIAGVRYITLDFLLAVKQAWLRDGNVRQKDVDDVQLIRTYLADGHSNADG